jgi:signal transduction histidine kinase
MYPSLGTAWSVLAGMGLGFFVVQPFAVLVYNLSPETRLAFAEFAFWQRLMEMSLSRTSLFMGLGFALLGGVSGFFLASWTSHKERLAAAQVESAKRLAAVETMQELMVTLAHYIRNANMVIGGFSLRLSKDAGDEGRKEQLRLIQEKSREIEAVISSLQNLTEISAIQYINSSAAKMIDLKEDLEKRLAAAVAFPESTGR